MDHNRSLSWSELLEECSKPARDFIRNPSSDRMSHDSWYGTFNYAEAMDLARNGWKDGLKDIAALSEQLQAPAAEVQQPFYDVAGAVVDVGRFLSGEPENMMEFEKTDREQAGKILTLNVNASMSARISSMAVMTRGAAICALVDQLEMLRYRVEVIVWTCQVSQYHRTTVRVVVKESSAPLEMDRIAFALANPSFNRRLSFRLRETLPPQLAKGFMRSNYGVSTDVKPEQLGEGLYMPVIKNDDFESMTYAKQWLNEQVQKFTQDEGQTI